MSWLRIRIWSHLFMWLLLILLYKETGAVSPFRGHVLWVAFPIPVEAGLVYPPFHTPWVVSLRMMAPSHELCGWGKNGAKFLWPWNKIDAPTAIFSLIGFRVQFNVIPLFYYNYIVLNFSHSQTNNLMNSTEYDVQTTRLSQNLLLSPGYLLWSFRI